MFKVMFFTFSTFHSGYHFLYVHVFGIFVIGCFCERKAVWNFLKEKGFSFDILLSEVVVF